MKKFIILLFVISATALTSQNYQYFTAKQGIPKAMEIAKDYFKNESVNLYAIRCVIFVGHDISEWGSVFYRKVSLEGVDHYNANDGTSKYWYYLIGDSNKCTYFKVQKYDDTFFVDSTVYNYIYPLDNLSVISIDDILIDSDEILGIIPSCNLYQDYFNPIFINLIINNLPYNFHFQDVPVWDYHESGADSVGVYDCFYRRITSLFACVINTITGECYWVRTDVIEKNITNSIFTIKAEPNTDNIKIELNSDLFQEAELRLYDQVGVLHFADKLNNKSYQLSTYNYPSGLYILQIKYGGNVITKTVLIVH